MTENEEIAFEILAIAESLKLHQASADAIYSLCTVDTELFNYHAERFVEAIFDTLKNESNFLQEIAAKLLERSEDKK